MNVPQKNKSARLSDGWHTEPVLENMQLEAKVKNMVYSLKGNQTREA